MTTLNEPLSMSPMAMVAPPMAHGSMIELGDTVVPVAPTTIEQTGVDGEVLSNLTLKLAYTVPRFTTQWLSERICLPQHLVGELLDQLREDNLVSVLGQVSPFNFRYEITDRGRERAKRLLEVSGYIGPAPVSLDSYRQNLTWQFGHLPQPTLEMVQEALADLVLPEEVVHVAGLAAMSRRGLFMHGPAGNGKTALAYALHDAIGGDMWVPHCIGIDDHIVRVFDQQCHEPVDEKWSAAEQRSIDHRWVRVRRPFIVVGGELTVEALELSHTSSLGFYEAPLHFKANGGTFVLDDFGCQRNDPQDLLNRWIHPLERSVDFLTLENGQQVEVPFQQMLVVSTNIDPEQVMSPAFLRRMGYRLYLGYPNDQRYSEIFHKYAATDNTPFEEIALKKLLVKYQQEHRPMRCCEPRDLIERARDICRFSNQPFELNDETLSMAWRGYFGAGADDDSGK
jgi:hypothetical protein